MFLGIFLGGGGQNLLLLLDFRVSMDEASQIMKWPWTEDAFVTVEGYPKRRSNQSSYGIEFAPLWDSDHISQLEDDLHTFYDRPGNISLCQA